MSKKINHWCIICGEGYHACDSCEEIQSFTPWRRLADTPEHYKIYLVLKQFNNKLMGKDEAKAMLANVDLTGKENFKESAKNVLDEIFKEEPIARKTSKKKSVKDEDVEVDVDIVKTKEGDTEE